jgi:rhodanese-related sulfurtransferase
MDIGQADLVAVKEQAARDWLAGHADTVIIESTPEIPLAGVAVNDKLAEGIKSRIRSAFTQLGADMENKLKRARLDTFEPADHADFEYVSTRGFYTPEVLPGAAIVTAEQVKKLMQQGVPLFDVRPQSHYRAGHIPNAVNVTYQMNSPKETEYDDAVDRFDIARLPKDKNAPMIFQCNGAECWYSYKASRYMIKRGYKNIYWFRTGLPAWKGAGYPIRQGA